MILIVVDDLMFSSRISSAAKAVGVTIRFARSVEAVLEAARQDRPALVILDLNGARMQPLTIVESLKADTALANIPTVGFVSHVDTTTIESARRAGVGRVLARSAFVDQLPDLLRQAAEG